jgi:hypothetical protein
MKHLKTYKVFESVDEIKSTIGDILRDNVSDRDIPLKIEVKKDVEFTSFLPNSDLHFKILKIKIGDEFFDESVSDCNININKLKEDILIVKKYLEEEGYIYKSCSYYEKEGDVVVHTGEDILKLDILGTCYLQIIFKMKIIDESIKVPIEIGDTILGGRFKNKKTLVKKIGKNKKGDITINDKPLLKYRILKESQEDFEYYFKHLEDDGFSIQGMNNIFSPYVRIFKPLIGSAYKFENCKPFYWNEISGEIYRYIDNLDDLIQEGKVKEYLITYIVQKNDHFDREFLNKEQILDLDLNFKLFSITISTFRN